MTTGKTIALTRWTLVSKVMSLLLNMLSMLSKLLIQFYVDGWGCVLSLLFGLRPNYSGGNEDNGNLLQKVLWTRCLSQCPQTLQQATTDPRLHQRLLDTHGQVWVSLSWGHCSFLLGPGAHKVLFVPCKSLFPSRM